MWDDGEFRKDFRLQEWVGMYAEGGKGGRKKEEESSEAVV